MPFLDSIKIDEFIGTIYTRLNTKNVSQFLSRLYYPNSCQQEHRF